MTEFFGSVWWLLVSLGLLVTFHEFGHYWVARRCGVRVLRFSVGFGKPLWSRIGRDGTEYVIAALPLGGYVKMLDEREVEVAPDERHESFNAKTVWQRIAIVAAGPLANLLLCLVLLWLMFVIGKPDFLPVIAQTHGLAAEAGFRPGDRILAVDGRETPTWSDAAIALATASMDRRATPVRVVQPQGGERLVTLPLDRTGLVIREAAAVEDIGLVPKWLAPLVGSVADGAAAEGGLKPGDLILRLGESPITRWSDLTPALQAVARPGETVSLRVRREGREVTVVVDPSLASAPTAGGEDRRWVLGIGPAEASFTTDTHRRYGLLAAIPAAFVETGNLARNTLGVLRRMITGHASLKNVSGPVTIARVANISASRGVAWFLSFLAILSLSLCIMNLLPIPVLDGGHLLYYLIELIKGSPVGERVLVAGQYVGLVFLAGLMGLAFYNDLFRPSF